MKLLKHARKNVQVGSKSTLHASALSRRATKFTPLALGFIATCGVLLPSTLKAEAANLTGTWKATAAYKDMYGKSGDGHAVWSLFGKKYVGGDAGLFFKTYDDGTAKFTGTIVQIGNSDKTWDVDLSFQSREIGEGGPKKELKDKAYKDHPSNGPVDPDTWHYYTIEKENSTITSISDDPETFYIADKTLGKFPVQVGIGANGKNVNFGLSTWFDVSKKISDNNYVVEDSHADINVDLMKVPEPTSMLGLLAIGAVTTGTALKRKQKG